MRKKSGDSKPTVPKKKDSAIAEQVGQIQELVRDLPDEERVQVFDQLISTIQISKTFTGPLPPPEDFEKYNQILPGAADRILAMAENEQRIRADGQTGILSNDNKRINVATFLGLALIVVAGIATWNGYVSIAVPLGLSGVVSVIFRQLLAWLNSRGKPEQ